MMLGCGYQFQGSQNPLRDVGIDKIYVQQFRNRTYTPGIEHLFSSAMIKEIQKSRSFVLVNSESEADALVSGEITNSDAGMNSNKSLIVQRVGDSDRSVNVAADYTASVACVVKLVDKNGRVVFSTSSSASKLFPGAARTGSQGATVSLINNSEQRLAVQFLASQMMASIYQRMIDAF